MLYIVQESYSDPVSAVLELPDNINVQEEQKKLEKRIYGAIQTPDLKSFGFDEEKWLGTYNTEDELAARKKAESKRDKVVKANEELIEKNYNKVAIELGMIFDETPSFNQLFVAHAIKNLGGKNREFKQIL